MNIKLLYLRLYKLISIFTSLKLSTAFISQKVFATVEHRPILQMASWLTIVDIGANKGQFSLASRYWAPNAKIISFEPLPKPSSIFSNLFKSDPNVLLHQVAIGPNLELKTMHLSAQMDSSSLLPMSDLQVKLFPGTYEVGTVQIQVGRLCNYIASRDIISPALLKLDVQGYEIKSLEGCTELIGMFDYVYVECSLVELYLGQKLASHVISFLQNKNFSLTSINNVYYDADGLAVQGDFLFKNNQLL
jgi:FkbM family methyltransferase